MLKEVMIGSWWWQAIEARLMRLGGHGQHRIASAASSRAFYLSSPSANCGAGLVMRGVPSSPTK